MSEADFMIVDSFCIDLIIKSSKNILESTEHFNIHDKKNSILKKKDILDSENSSLFQI